MEYIIIITNLILTLPSIIIHGIKSCYERYKYRNYSNIEYNTVQTQNLILMIHGHNGHPSNFEYLAKHLLKNKYIKNNYNVHAIKFAKTNGYSSIESEIKQIENYLNNKYESVILIGLSKGGLTCCNALSYYITNKLNKIQKIITISSPLYGTTVANNFLPEFLEKIFPNVKHIKNELGHYSKISLNTSSILSSKNKIPIYHIVPEYDHLIYPTTSAKYYFTSEHNIYYCKGMFGRK